MIRGWWVTVQNCARKKRTFDNLCFESSTLTVKYHEQGSQDSNNVETKVKTFQHASGNRCLHKAGKFRPPRTAVAAAAIPWQYIRGQRPTTDKKAAAAKSIENTSKKNKRIFREDRIWDSGWHTYRRHSVDTLIFKYVWFDTMVNPRGRRGVIRIWESHTSSIEKKIGKDVMYEDRMHCFHCRRFKTRFEICKNADKELSDIRVIRRHSAEIIILSRLTNHVMFHHNARWHTQNNVSHPEKRVAQRKSDTQRERPTHTHTHTLLRIKHDIITPKRKEGLGPKRKEGLKP